MNSWLLRPGRWSAGLPPPKDTTPCQAETELDTVLSWTDPVWGLAAELGQFSDSNSTPCEPTICPGRWRPEREAGVRRTPASVAPQRGASRKERPAGVRPAAAGARGRPSEHQRARGMARVSRGLLWWPGPRSVSWQEHSTAHLALTLLQGQNAALLGVGAAPVQAAGPRPRYSLRPGISGCSL